MATSHRKTLTKSIEIFIVVKKPCVSHPCHDLPPPSTPTPPTPPSASHSLSPFLILMFCGLALSFTFICSLVLYKRYLNSSNNLHPRNPSNSDENHEVFVDEDHGPIIHHPIWLINTIGLDQSVIDSIEIFKYKKDDPLIEGTDCSVCLSEFQENESLRLLPKCCHAFHVPCIDTWLRSHKNCPLCRAPIIKNASNAQSDTIDDPRLIESSTIEEIPDGDFENLDHLEPNQTFEVGFLNHNCVEREEHKPMRRSVSMVVSKRHYNMAKRGHKRRGSSPSICICSRVMKSSSFGRSLRKARSFRESILLDRGDMRSESL